MDTDKIVIRPIEDKDLIKIGDLVMKALLPHLIKDSVYEAEIKIICQKYSPENLKVKITDSDYFVAENPKDKNILGVIGLKKEVGNKTHCRLSTFFVDPVCQNRGVGRILYEKVRETALKKGYKTMLVKSSPSAEQVYAHFGFKKVRIDWKIHENGRKSYNVWMEQDLTSCA